MKYLSEEKYVEIKTISERQVEYIRCDKCGKKIMPYQYSTEQNRYVNVHTWHNDWGNDSIDSHEYHDYCTECAKVVVSEYIDDMDGSEELKLSNEYLFSDETHRGTFLRSDGYMLSANDNK